MPRLRNMSGAEVLSALTWFGFSVVTQKGSHVKLRRTGNQGQKEILTVPLHPQMDKGTLRAIFRQACAYIPENDLRPFFFAD